MQEQRTTNMRKCQCMKLSCIISGCPAGAKKWHISYFAMLLHSKIITAEIALYGDYTKICLRFYTKSADITVKSKFFR